VSVQVVSRFGWGAAPPSSPPTFFDPSWMKGACVHYTASDADEQADHVKCGPRVRGIQRYHMESRGYRDIAYNFLVCRHGYCFVGRGWHVVSAGQGCSGAAKESQGNLRYHAFCFLGNDTANRVDFSPEAAHAMSYLISNLRHLYPGRDWVVGHRYVCNTGCPGDEILRFIEATYG
jgi:hypothetical protein